MVVLVIVYVALVVSNFIVSLRAVCRIAEDVPLELGDYFFGVVLSLTGPVFALILFLSGDYRFQSRSRAKKVQRVGRFGRYIRRTAR